MLEKTLAAVIGLIVVATATMIALAAAGLALFWLLSPLTGPAGAAAVVAGVFALIVAIAVVAAALRGGHHHHHHDEASHQPDFGFIERIIDMAKERPILSVGAALAAAVIAFRNPALVATIVAAFVDRPKKG
jgi:hypothetical protein